MEVESVEAKLAAPWPDGLFAVTLFVDDLAESVQFYRKAFGLPVTFADEDSTVFDFGNIIINLLRTGNAADMVTPATVGASGGGVRMQLSVNVASVDHVCTRLVDNGVELLNGPMDRPWGLRTATFQDPDGNVWEIAHPLAGIGGA